MFEYIDIRTQMDIYVFFFFQAEDGIRDVERSRGLGDVYKRQYWTTGVSNPNTAPRLSAPKA